VEPDAGLDAGLDPMTLRSRPEPKPRVRHITACATQAPHP